MSAARREDLGSYLNNEIMSMQHYCDCPSLDRVARSSALIADLLSKNGVNLPLQPWTLPGGEACEEHARNGRGSDQGQEGSMEL